MKLFGIVLLSLVVVSVLVENTFAIQETFVWMDQVSSTMLWMVRIACMAVGFFLISSREPSLARIS